MAGQRALALSPGQDHRHCPRHQPRCRGGQAPALCRADDRLDPPAEAHSGDDRAGRPAGGLQALRGRGRPPRDVPMTQSFFKVVLEDFAEGGRMIARALEGYWQELGELGEDPVRTRQGLVAACSVMLATVLALLLDVESPWWAAISGFMSLMATGAGSLHRGLLRLSGTIAGAVLGFVMARWLPYDHFALCLFLAGTTMLGVIAMQVSPHGLAWLFLTITSSLVLLMSLDNPQKAIDVAFYRTFEVAIGVTSAVIVANLLQDCPADPPPTAPGWPHLLCAQWPSLLHGTRSSIALPLP